MAITIVLALIPVYLQTKNVVVYQPGPGMYNLYRLQTKHFSFLFIVPFLVSYATNLNSTTGLTISNPDDLAAQVDHFSFLVSASFCFMYFCS